MREPVEIYRKEATARILMAKSTGCWEGSHTDFKRQLGNSRTDYAKLVRHLLAFANTPRRAEAFIIFGFEEDKDRHVFERYEITKDNFPAKETIEQIVQAYTNLEGIFVDDHFIYDGRRTPYIVIPMQDDGPCTTTRTGLEALNPTEIFCRYGSRSVRAEPRHIARMRADWETWFLDVRYEKTASSMSNTLARRFPNHSKLEDIGPCVRLVYDSRLNDEFGTTVSPGLVHAYWGFEPVDADAVDRIADDKNDVVVRKTLIGARFAPNTTAVATALGVRCVPLDEIYFVNDSYSKLCRAFLELWEKDKQDCHLSSLIDLDFRTEQRSDSPARQSVVTFLEDQLKSKGKSAVLVHGDFGCGKTTTAKQLVAELYEDYLKGNTATPKVLYVNVNNIDIRARRDECIEGELRRYRLGADQLDDLIQQINKDEIQLIFDGVDEMARPHTDAGRKEAIELLREIGNRRTAIYLIRSSYFPEFTEMIAAFHRVAEYDFKAQRHRITVIQISELRPAQVNDYLDSRLGAPEGAAVRSALHEHGVETFLTDPLIISLVCSLVEREGISSIDGLPREGEKATFLARLVHELLKRERDKRQRHRGLAEDFRQFQKVTETVAFDMICKGLKTIRPNHLQKSVKRAFETSGEESPAAVDEFRTMAWIQPSADGELAFRHDALTLVCASQYVNRALENRSSLELGDWQPQAPLADIVYKYAGQTINSLGVLGATQMLSGSLQFNVRDVVRSVLQVASARGDCEPVSDGQLTERDLASICRGIIHEPSLARLPVQILLKSLGEKRSIQVTVILLWFFSKDSPKEDVVRIAIDLVHRRVRRNWNFCDDLRDLKENPTASLDLTLLRDLGVSARDLMDSTQYEVLFKAIYSNPKTETSTKQFVDRTLRGIEGEKHRRLQLARFTPGRGKE